MSAKKKLLQLLLVAFLFQPTGTYATSPVCGGYLNLKPESIAYLLDEYENAYKEVGFTVTKKEIIKNQAGFRATYIVPSSRFQWEVQEEFHFNTPDYKDAVYQSCGALMPVKEPKEYTAVERNEYVSKFEENFRKAAESLNKKFPKSIGRQ